MTHDLHHPDEFTFVCRQFGVPWRKLSAEECHRPSYLVQNGTNVAPQRVAFDYEGGVDGGELENRDHSQYTLQHVEGLLRLRGPAKAILAQYLGERVGDHPVILDKPAVVTDKAQEGAHSLRRLGQWPIEDGLYLQLVHGDVI
jgi:hypothetical protein